MISRKFILAAASLVAASAYAGSVSLDARVDMVGKSYDKVNAKPSNALTLTRAKLDAKGKLNDSVEFRTRVNLAPNPSTEVAGNPEAVSNRADFIYISNKLTDSVNVTLGKIGSGMGGIEGQYNGGDVYLLSQGISGGNVTVPLYLGGADLTVKIADGQTVDVLMLNQTENSTEQTRTMAGALYNGVFLDKALKVAVSYHTEQYNDNIKANYIAAGARFSAGPVEVEGDYLMNKKSNSTNTDKNDSTDVVRVKAKYMVDQFTPFVQYEMSTNKTADDKANDVAAITAALEYKPVKEENFRYHLAYVNSAKKPATGDTQTSTFVYAGVRVLADFLK